MIKCNVTVVGSVYRNVELKKGRNENPFATFGITVQLMEGQEEKGIDLSIANDGENDFVLSLKKGDRVKIKGVLTFKRRDDNIYFNLSADEVTAADSEEDAISGDIQFRGTLGNKEIHERKGKKGNFRIFDAYSTEKIDENNYAYTWVHFVDFNNPRPEWLAPRVKIEVEGTLELQVFNGKVQINCLVGSLSPWNKETSN